MAVRAGRLVAAILAFASSSAVLMFATRADAGGQSGSAPAPARVVIFTLPGVTWESVVDAHTPTLDRLTREGAIAALSLRSALRPSTPLRGYLTLGAGNRASAPLSPPAGHYAGTSEDRFENSTAAEVAARRAGRMPDGDIVHPGIAALQGPARGPDYGARPGALGEALRRAGAVRGVISAADLSPDPGSSLSMRREAVLAIADEAGGVDVGRLDGLVVTESAAPFGVRTDPSAFDTAVERALAEARVVLVEPGDTLRADEYATFAPLSAQSLAGQALEWSDDLLGDVAARLDARRDLLLVVGLSSPSRSSRDRLGVLVAWGAGIEPGTLASPTTRTAGLTALTDVGPTVLAALGIDRPESMSGMPVAHAGRRTATAADLARLDRASLLRDEFAPLAVTILIVLLVVMSVMAFVVFLIPARPPAAAIAVRLAAYAALATPPATVVLRAVQPSGLTVASSAMVLVGIVCALVGAALFVPGPAWGGGVALVAFSLVLSVADLLAGSPLQLNSAFGYSPILGGRYYGLGNVGFAMLLASGILAPTGLADLRGRVRASWTLGGGLLLLVPLVGLPPLGADFGGVLAVVPAILVTFALGRAWRLDLKAVLLGGTAAVVLAAAAAGLDLLRAPEARTHLGRFAAEVASGGLPVLARTIERKLDANLSVLASTVWTYTIPLGVAVLVLLLWRPRGVLSRVIPAHPLLRAGLWGSIVGGLVGFAVNDSGVAIPGMVLAHVVPLFVLLAVSVADRAPAAHRPLTTAAPQVPP